MKVYKLETFIFAENETEIKELQQALYDFVLEQRNKGRAVTANKIKKALEKAKNNYFVNQFLK